MIAVIFALFAAGLAAAVLMPLRTVGELTVTGLEPSSEEWLRDCLARHTGREIGQLYLEGGRWYAVTARGHEEVSALLKGPKNPGARLVNY